MARTTTTTRARRRRNPPIPVMPCPQCGADSARLAQHQYLYRNRSGALQQRDSQVFGCVAGLQLSFMIGGLALVAFFLYLGSLIPAWVPLALGSAAGVLFVLWVLWVSVLSFAPPSAVRYTCQQCGRVWQTLLSN